MHYIISNAVPISAATLVGLLIGAAYRALASRHGGGVQPVLLLVVAAVAEFWLAAILAGALIMAPVQADAWTIALGSAGVIWIGFVVPVLLLSYAARRLGAAAIALDCAHWLAVMLAQAAVLHVVGLVRP